MAAVAAAELAVTKRKRKRRLAANVASGGATRSGRTAHARAVTRARKDLTARLAAQKKAEDPYAWYAIRTPEAIIAENAIALGGELPTDLNVPEVLSPTRRAGLSSEEDDEEEEQDIDLNQQAFLQGIGAEQEDEDGKYSKRTLFRKM